MRLRVDPIACRAHGLCAELVPELVDLDEWGYPILPDGKTGHIPLGLHDTVRAAVSACPTLALRIDEEVPR